MFQAKKCTVTKYVIQTDINSLTPFYATDVPYTSCTGTSVYPLTYYITLAYVYTHTKLFHNTSYLITQKKKINKEWFNYRAQNPCSFILHWKSM
jgi:hypothetical protein